MRSARPGEHGGGRGGPARGLFATLVLVVLSAHFAMRPLWMSWAVAPDFLVVGLLLAARSIPAGYAAGLGFALGLLEDSLSVSRFGAAALVLTVVGYLGARSRDFFLGDEPLFTAAYLFAGKWAVDLALGAFVGDMSWMGSLVLSPASGALSAAAGAGLVAVARWPR